MHHAREWLIRFGDGTDESHRRAQAALDYLMPYTREFFSVDAVEETIAAAGIGPLTSDLEAAWLEDVRATLDEATLNAAGTGQARHDRQAWRALRTHGLRAG